MSSFRFIKASAAITVCAVTLGSTPGVGAQTTAPVATDAPAAPASAEGVRAGPLSFSPDVTLKLIEMLVSNGQLSRIQADELIAAASVRGATGGTPAAGEVRQVLREEPNTIVVPYVPESVRRQLKKELREEVLAEAKGQGWAQPNQVPEWTKRITLSGDVRFRTRVDTFGRGNFNGFVNFAAANAGTGLDLNFANSITGVNPPFLNTTVNRRREQLRARLALDAQISPNFSVNARIATGNDNNPVSLNQTLGTGNFSKYNIWLDRASIRFTPAADIHLDFGRFANPFWTTSLIFDEDVNFDGVALQSLAPLSDQLRVSAAGGIFPVFNTDFNFGSNSTIKTKSRDKFLAAANVAAEYDLSDTVHAKLGVGYYHYVNVEGVRSSLCAPLPRPGDACDTDTSRPQFQQFGNTVFYLRNNIAVSDPTLPQLQYFGLASKFHILEIHGRAAIDVSDNFTASLDGEFVRNLAFSRNGIARRFLDQTSRGGTVANPQQDLLVNNFGPTNANGTSSFDGGRDGFNVSLGLASKSMDKLGDFAVQFGYRRLDTDAVLDAFAESDFHLGGTNAKGFVLIGSAALTKGVAMGARWYSSDAVRGPRYSADTIILDLTAGF